MVFLMETSFLNRKMELLLWFAGAYLILIVGLIFRF